ncbi:hypothetical protein FHX49_000905 [Microbacterium endophyticum]|uniref:Schlafen AlbA-2 domain-containing protein n=1 Tax=Microbacterium endophyticum TaxID=1526412 RepID=A0A7W4YMB9_9MICO|nr:ATP-binding protein [Microbacterium endophyticum]MBB2975339.1 hypothetical protein [Microbacterium endophyticum]NIK35642.1 hypothetical protein [Microbacterium endophyticum]
MPQNTVMVEFALAIPGSLLIAALIALLIRWIFGRRLSLSLPVMMLTSLLGLSLGLLAAGWFIAGVRIWTPVPLLLAFGFSVAISFIVAALFAASRRARDRVDVDAVLSAGESDRVEFKETARWNVRESKRDSRMELAIAKTVAAFLNSGGGVLVIGANDDGEALGLDRDLSTLRVSDADRFELWLRDLFSTLLGRNAAALPRVQFDHAANGALVCCVACPSSPRPVYVTQSKDGASTDLWVRVGNSTRSFAIDEAVEYVGRHWRQRSLLRGRSG